MTSGNVLQKWKDYCIYFKVDVKTAKRRLRSLGFKVSRFGAPMIRREVLDQRIDAHSTKK